MTAVATLAGAPTCGAVDWNTVDWKKVNRTVRRLQARIVKAIKETVLSPPSGAIPRAPASQAQDSGCVVDSRHAPVGGNGWFPSFTPPNRRRLLR